MKRIHIVLGMAGSGKTTFCHRLYSWLSEKNFSLDKESGLNELVYGANLDPAVVNAKMPLSYDIRDHLSIEEVMHQKKLGPNGAILTILNMFSLHIDKFIQHLESSTALNVVIDTPGQIEMFTTSISGTILVQCLSSNKNNEVVLLYVSDGVQSQRPQCFMINMVYATSIMFRFEAPLLFLLNKADCPGSEQVTRWISDMYEFLKDLDREEYISTVLHSMSLYLEEFYQSLHMVSVSSRTGYGQKEFFMAADSLFPPPTLPEENEHSAEKKEKIDALIDGVEGINIEGEEDK